MVYQPSQAQDSFAPFSSQPAAHSGLSTPASLISFNGTIQKNKVILEWTVDDNQTADKFEVEKSTDGTNYRLTALVFGTDKADKGIYRFLDKAGDQKMLYRIKLISKNKQTEYSSVIEINPVI